LSLEGAVHLGDRTPAETAHAKPSIQVLTPGAAPPCEAPSALRELIAWWQGKAGGALPDISALDPVELRRHLASVALLDVEEGDFRFRLVGEEMRARYGPLRGRRLSDCLIGEALADTAAEHRACAAAGRPTLARRAAPRCDGTDRRRYWRLLLPFGREGRTAVILAAMQFDPARPPR
jgi:hypothetical protein